MSAQRKEGIRKALDKNKTIGAFESTSEEAKEAVTSTSKAKLQKGLTRATMIVEEDKLIKLKNYAFTERLTLKEVVDAAFSEFLEAHYVEDEIIHRY